MAYSLLVPACEPGFLGINWLWEVGPSFHAVTLSVGHSGVLVPFFPPASPQLKNKCHIAIETPAVQVFPSLKSHLTRTYWNPKLTLLVLPIWFYLHYYSPQAIKHLSYKTWIRTFILLIPLTSDKLTGVYWISVVFQDRWFAQVI